MSFLYVTDSSAQIGISDRYYTVKYRDGMVQQVPCETLESISIFGRAQVTSQCVQSCLQNGVSIIYYSAGGRYFGRLVSTGHMNVERQRLQAKLIDTPLALQLSKKIIKSKIHNQIVVMKRYARSREMDVEPELAQMKIAQNKVDLCEDVTQLMGYEGIAARNYFKALGRLVEPDFKFECRSRRPPKDEFNSMLSLGYSILLNETYGKIEAKGLHPYFGFMHQGREKHPTLASDLMEEWRPVIVDSMVMSLVNGHEMKLEHFYTDMDQPGIFITKDGMKIFINKMEAKLRTENKYLTEIPYETSFRRAIELQVMSFVRALEENDPDYYHPIWIR